MTKTELRVATRADRNLTRLAIALWLIALLLMVASMALTLADSDADRGREDSPIIGLLFLFEMFAFVSVGALLAARRPRHPIGWLLLGNGFVSTIAVAADAYARHTLYADPGSIPAGEIAAWVGSFVIDSPAFSFGFFVFLFLLFPHGRLPSPRWRLVLWLLVPVMLLEQALVSLKPGELPAFPGVENPFGIAAFETLAALEGTLLLLIAALLASLISLVMRFRRSAGEERQQLKLIVVACAFLALAITSAPFWWILAPEHVSQVAWPALFAVSLASVPVAVGTAILRYRLYDIDLIINRAIVYGSLTAVLAGLYAASIQLFKVVFETVTGETSDVSIILTTLLLAAAFTPAKNRLQKLVDRYYGQVHDAEHELDTFANRVQSVSRVLDTKQIARELLEQAVESLAAEGGALYLYQGDQASCVATAGEMSNGTRARIALLNEGEELGYLTLGRPLSSEAYAEENLEKLQTTANVVAHAIALTVRAAVVLPSAAK